MTLIYRKLLLVFALCILASTFKSEAQTITTNPAYTVGNDICGADVLVTYAGTCSGTVTYSWTFAGGKPATGSGPGPFSVNWTTAGNHIISVTESAAGCASHTTNKTIKTLITPDSLDGTFTIASSRVCVGDPNRWVFTGNLITESPNVDFGPGSSAAYVVDGTYDLSWNAPGPINIICRAQNNTSGCYSPPTTAHIVVKPLPSDTFTYTTAGCNQAIVTHVGTGSNKATYTWTIAGGGTPVPTPIGTGPSTITWGTPNTYNVTLSAVDTNGCSSGPYTLPITVTNTFPNSNFTLTPGTVCSGSPVTATYTGNAPSAAFTWNFNGGTAVPGTGVGPQTITWATGGSKTVSLSVASGTCSAGAATTNSVTVTASPTATISPAIDSICTATPTTFTYTGTTPGSGALSYVWNFGGGTGGVAGSVGPQNLSWATTGTHVVTLQVTQGTCVSTLDSAIVVTSTPYTSTFTALPATVCNTGTPITVTYTGNAPPANASIKYNWNFDGGTIVSGTSGSRGPYTISWPTTGTKNIILTIELNGCSTVTSKPITVTTTPTSTFTATSPVCAGSPSTLTYTGNTPTGGTYTWNFAGGTGGVAGVGPQAITWAAAGTYTATLTVASGGCTSTSTPVAVVVSPTYTSTFTVPATAICGTGTNATITYTGNAPGGATYNWNFNGGTGGVAGAGPQAIAWASPGTYTVTLSVGSGTCTSAITSHTVTVNAKPSSAFTATSPVCVGSPSTLTYTGGAPAVGPTYTWNFNGGTGGVAGAGPQAITWATAGTYTPTLTVTLGGCASTSTSASVVVSPTYTSTFTVPATAICGVTNAAAITYTGNAPGGATYNWTFNGGTGGVAGAGPQAITWASAGTYTVTLSVGSGTCTSAITSHTVTVNAQPSSAFTATSPVCVGSPSTLTYTGGAPAVGPTYTWNFNGGTGGVAGAGPQAITWATAGTYTPTLTVTSGGCASTSTSASVVVSPTYTSAFTVPAAAICGVANAATITYTGNAPGGATYNWTFNGGTGGVAGAGPQAITWPGAGTYTVTLSVGSGSCASATTTHTVTVYDMPTSSFTNTAPVCVGSPSILTYSGTQIAGATYTWNFNGGTGGVAGVGPQAITWAAAGTYTPTLIVAANGCTSSSSSASVVVSPTYTSAFTVPATAICGVINPATITYTGTAPGGATYNWNFNGGTGGVAGAGPQAITWPSAGTYTVTLSVSSSGSCASTTTSHTVIVSDLPTSTFTASSPVCVGSPSTLTYTGTAPVGSTYTWNFAGGTGGVVGAGPQAITWAATGTYTTTLTVSSNGCTSSSTPATVVVSPTYTSTFTVPATAICGVTNPAAITYTGNAPGGATYNWTFDGGTGGVAGAGPQAITWAAAGTYTVTLSVGSGSCVSAVTSHTVIVNDLPTSTFTASSPVCVGSPSTLTYTGTAPGGSTYTWNFAGGTGGVVGAGPQAITWAATGTYTTTLTVSSNGCTSSSTPATVVVSPTYTSTFTVPAAPICGVTNPAAIAYTGNAPGGATYNWTFDGGTGGVAGAGPQAITWAAAGTYTVTLSVGSGLCVSAVTSHTVIVNDLPTSTFTASSPVCIGSPSTLTYTGTAPGGSTYTWNFAGGTGGVAGAGPQAITWAAAGTYTTTLTVSSNGCTSSSSSASVVVSPTYTSTFTVPAAPICGVTNPAAITYTGNAPGGATYNWSFDGGTGGVAGAGPQAITWATPGTYTVTLSIGSGSCISTTTSNTVVVYDMPASTFTAISPVCIGSPSTLTYTGGAPAIGPTYTWNFAGGTGGVAGAGPQAITWAAAGTYTTTLTVSANGCTSSSTPATVVVSPTYTSAFTVPAAPICGVTNPAAITYTGNAPGGATYNWSFNGGTGGVAGAGPQAITWAAAGTYTVTLSIGSGSCISTTTSNTVVIYDMPASTFTATSPVCIASPSTLTYTGTPIAGATYTWNFDGGTGGVVGAGPQAITWASAGTYTPTLTVAANGCTSANTPATVVVSPTYTSTFTVPAAPVCGTATPATITYTGNAPGGATYNWSFNGGTGGVAGAGPQAITWAAASTYTVTLSIGSGSCLSSTTSQTVVVNTVPTATFNVDNPSICFGTNSTFTYSGSASAGATYNWNFGTGTAAPGGTVRGPQVVTWPAANTYNVTLSVTENGCTSTTGTQSVVVSNTYTSAFNLSAASVCSAGIPVTITYTGNAPGGATYNWTFNGGTAVPGTGQGPQTVSWATTGLKTVTLSVTGGSCPSGTTSQTVDVGAAPTSAFSVDHDSICTTGTKSVITYTGTASAAATYNWNFGGGTIVSGSTQGPYTISWPAAGKYTITLGVSEGGCTSATSTHNVVVSDTFSSKFNVSSATLCGTGSPVTATYSGTAPNTPGIIYYWNYGGGTGIPGSTVQGPQSVSWGTTGSKTISLTVKNGNCPSSSTTQSVQVNPIPTSAFAVDNASICMGANSTFTYGGNASAGATYNWNFGTGAANPGGTVQGPQVVTWPAAATYSVTLGVSENGCTSSTTTKSVIVSDTFSSKFGVSSALVCGTGTKITATYSGNAPNTPGIVYNWNFGGGTAVPGSTVQGPQSVSWNTTGAKTITLTVKNGNCPSTTVTQNVQVNTIPTSTFKVDNASICAGTTSTFTYSGNASAGATYNWNFGTGTANPGGTVVGPQVVTWIDLGNHPVTLSVTDAGCTSAATTTVNVNVDSVPKATFSASQHQGCTGSGVILTYTAASPANATYTWNFAGGTATPGTGKGPQKVTWNTVGEKIISLVVKTGCPSVPFIDTIYVHNTPSATFTSPAQICLDRTPATVTFTGTSTTTSTNSWTFNGTTPSTANTKGPFSLQWNSRGTFQILSVVSDSGCSSRDSSNIVVRGLPGSSYTIVHSPVCTGTPDSIVYTGATSANSSFQWGFDGGNGTPGGTGEGPQVVTWASSGSKNISLAVTDSFCTSDTTITALVVNPVPTASYSASPASSACLGTPTVFTYTGTASNAANYQWNFGGGTATPGGTTQGPQSVQWPATGAFKVKLTVTENGCTSDSNVTAITVYPVPTAVFTNSPLVCGGVPLTVTYAGTASPAATYNWDFGSGSATPGGTTQGPQNVTWATGGQYHITLSVTENGCTSSVLDSLVTVNPKPAPAFTMNPAPICANGNTTITYTGTPNALSTYVWTFDGGVPAFSNTIGPNTVTFSNPVTHSIKLVEKSSGCADSVTQLLVVNPIPVAHFLTNAVDNTICANKEVTITFDGQASSSAVYTWSIGSGQLISGSLNSQGPLVAKYTNQATEYITLSISDNGCLSTPFENDLNVSPTPIADFTAPFTGGCNGLAVNFVNLSSYATNYFWSFGDSTVDSLNTNPVHVYSNGAFDVKLIAINPKGCSDTLVKKDYINVQSTPKALFTVDPGTGIQMDIKSANYSFTNQSTDAFSYLWNFGDGDTSSVDNPIHKYNDTGTYYVTLIAYNSEGCSDTFKLGPIIIIPADFILFPTVFTPNGDGINDVFKSYGAGLTEVDLTIFDRWGEKVYEGDGLNEGWNGRCHGIAMNSDVFVYFARIVKSNGKSSAIKGDITLLK